MTPILRPARPDEADALTALLRRSKASWGYSEAFIRRVVNLLSITAQQIQSAIAVYVLEVDGRVVGFYHLRDNAGQCWLEDLFIEPDAMHKGYGKTLFEHALCSARAAGYAELYWESDPNAEGFYLKLGASRIGEKPSIIKGRMLPQMRIVLK